MPSIKRNAPTTEKWGQNFERRFLCFHKDSWISFSFGLLDFNSGFSKGPGSWFFGLWTFWIGFTKDTIWFLRTLDVLDALSQGLDLVFLDVGLVFLLDFGLTYNLFSFACIKIEILSAFISFHRLLFNQLLGKLICI